MSNENNENVQMNVVESTQQSSEQQTKPVEQQVNVNTPVTVPLFHLLNLRNIIDVSTSRGTFKSNELTSVGKVYDELSSIINSVVQQVTKKESEEANTTSSN